MGFKQDFAAMMKRAAGREDQLVRMSALGLGTAVVNRSPVDSGRFRGNWQYGAGQVNFDINSPEDKTGASSIGRIAVGLQGWKRGETIYITESLPYSRKLEYGLYGNGPKTTGGYSTQAVGGMVRISVMEFKANIKKQAASL
jgi:hypothetical protein